MQIKHSKNQRNKHSVSLRLISRSFLLIILCTLLASAAQAQYTLTDDDVEVVDGVITAYTSDETNIVIPNELDGQVITSIGADTFFNKSLSSVDLSAATQLTTIGANAFQSNPNLSTVNVSGLTNLATIGDFAFNASGLSSFDFASLTNLKTIGTSAFRGSSNFASTEFSDLPNLTSIGARAFYITSISSFSLPSPTTEGYTFNGWEDSDGAIYTNGDDVSDFDQAYTAVVESITTYSITYHADGGSHSNVLATYTVEDEATFSDATKAGYTFEGWYTESEFINQITGISGTTGDLDLYAKFSLTSYAITYHADGGSYSNPASYTIDDAVTFSTASKNGYAFDGWFSEPEFNNEITGITAGSTGEVTLYAKFSAITYNLTYEADGGSHSNVLTYTVEDEVNFSAAAKEGYAFDGWYTESEFTNQITSITPGTTGDLTMFAKFSLITYNITYEADGGSHTNSDNYTIHDEVTLTGAAKEGYTFEGWYTEPEYVNEITTITSGSTGEVTLFGKFSPIAYTITYHPNDASHSNPATYTIEDALVLTAATKDEHVFYGWYTDPAFTNETTEITLGTTGNLHLYGDLEYTLTDDDVVVVDGEITSYMGSATNIAIPNELDGQVITSIGSDAFRKKNLTAVDLSQMSNLKTIGVASFFLNSITTVNLEGLSNLLTIHYVAFAKNLLTSVDLTSLTSLRTISTEAFRNNLLTSIDFSGLSSLHTIAPNIFSGNSISEFVLPSPTLKGQWRDSAGKIYAANATVSASPAYSYVNNEPYTLTNDDVVVENGEILSVDMKLYYTDIIIPNQLDGQIVSAIGKSAFYNKRLAAVDLSELTNLTSIGASAFRENQLTAIDLSGFSNLTTIGEKAFTHNSLTVLELPRSSNLTSIKSQAFEYNDLISVDLSKLPNLEEIGDEAFKYNSLGTVDVSGLTSLTYIGKSAFAGNLLTTFDFSELTNLITIGEAAFQFNSLTSVDFTGLTQLATIERLAFSYNDIITLDFTGLTNLITIGAGAFYKNSITTVDVSEFSQLTTIGDRAFNGNGFSEITLPSPDLDGEWKDVNDAIYSSGQSVSVSGGYYYTSEEPYTLTSDDVEVENGEIVSVLLKMNYKNIIIPNVLDEQEILVIGDELFYNTDLNSVDLSGMSSLTTIGSSAFLLCQLTELNLSGLTNLITIKEGAFESNKLTAVDFTGLTNLTTIENSAFRRNELVTVNFQGLTNLKTIGGSAFIFNNITDLDFTGLTSLSTIERYAFGDNELTSVDLTPLTNLTFIAPAVFHNTAITSFSLPSPSIEGYNFNGWKDENNVTYDNGTTVDNLLISYTAVVESLVDYSVTFHANGGIHDNLLSMYTVEDDVILEDATKEGYEFMGWYTDASYTSPITTIKSGSTGDLALYAQFEVIEYAIIHDADGGQHDNPDSYTIEDEVSLTDASKNGYNFEGWFLDEELATTVTEIEAGTTGDMTLYAKYEPISYDISYSLDGGTHENPANFTIEDVITFAAASKEGYTFDGWFADATYQTAITEIASGSTGDVELFAKFSLVSYAITYHADGGSHDNPETYTIEDAVTFAAATKEGFEFEGWYTDEIFTHEVTDIAKGSTGEMGLFAKFTAEVLGLNDLEFAAIKLYPNPVVSSFSVDADVDQIHVLSLDGQLMQSFIGNQAQYDVSHLATGHYIVQLIDSGRSIGTKKIIIDSNGR